MNGVKSRISLNGAQCAPLVSLNKLTVSGVSPSAPATAFNALAPATNDVANARAHEMEIIRAHRLLHARKAGLTSEGCSSRARELARLSTNWTCSRCPWPRRRRGTDRQPTTLRILSPCPPWPFRRYCRPLGQIPAWALRCSSERSASDVHRQLSSVKQREPRCEDLNAPFVFGPHRHVHIPEQTVESHVGSSFAQDSGQSLGSHCPWEIVAKQLLLCVDGEIPKPKEVETKIISRPACDLYEPMVLAAVQSAPGTPSPE